MMLPNLMSIKGIGKKRYQTITSKMIENNWSLDDVYTMSPETLKRTFGLPINVAKAMAEVGQNVKRTHTVSKSPDLTVELSEKNIRVLEKTDDYYPKRLLDLLGTNAPDKLYVWGNLELFDKPSVGFCGSRNVTEKGLEVTADVAEQIAKLGWVVVSGHARGVDVTAHLTALKNDAGTIIVLPQGIDGFKLRSELRQYATPENLLVISEFPLKALWNVGYAMQRNHTIIALSDAMTLVESRTEGGTFNAGKTALNYQRPLFVVSYEDTSRSNAGNEYFIQRGAIRLMKSRTTSRANIATLQKTVEKRQSCSDSSNLRPQQLTMELETE